MSHPFFKNIDWKKLIKKQLKPPFKPKIEGDDWIKNFDKDFTKEQPRDTFIKVDLDKLKNFQKDFAELNFNIEESND